MSIRLTTIQNALSQWFQSKTIIDELSTLVLNLPFKWQDYVLDQILTTSKSCPEIAYQYALRCEKALNLLDKPGTEQWLHQSLSIHKSGRTEQALTFINNLEAYVTEYESRPKGLMFEDIRSVLQHFIYGLNGRYLEIRTGHESYTDSETIFLPEIVSLSVDNEINFALYKALAVHQWSQCWYGTWRAVQYQPLLDNPQLIPAFHRLESERLNACIGREFPGLTRQLNSISPENLDSKWRNITESLRLPESNVTTTFSVLVDLAPEDIAPTLLYQGCLKPELVNEVQLARIDKEKKLFLDNLSQSIQQQIPEPKINDTPDEKLEIDDPTASELQHESPLSKLDLNIATLPTDDDLDNLLISIKQDFGDIPSNYTISTGSSDYAANLKATEWQQEISNSHESEQDERIEPFYYDEWDCTRQAHRKQWCALYETPVSPDFSSSFVATTLHKYRGNIRTISRNFEALRDEYTILKRQPDGDRLDLDALVEAMSDIRTGKEMPSRLYRKSMRHERNIAVVFMVDMSGSTKGWINTAQREALILLSEALKTLDDRYAIYGFSSKTRKHCELYTIKTFDDRYDETVQARIAAIEPHDYTRMGPTIRHLTQLLDKTRARRKLLITLSDGKPDDYDSYHGEYGIEDTRMALLEAKGKSIHSFCITIDEKAREYLPHMYGASNYILIDDVEKLPYRLSDVYRGLTS